MFFRSGGQNAAPVAQTQVAAAPGFAANAAFDPLAAGPASTAAQPADPTAVQNRQDQKEAFMKAGPTETRNSGNLTLPISPYQVMAGTVVAGALVTGIKSDLPGDVIATVTEPVYDTATGRFLLIPQGSRITGKYNSRVSYGQSRVQVVWNRIILPDTSSLTLDNWPAPTQPAMPGWRTMWTTTGAASLPVRHSPRCWASVPSWPRRRTGRMVIASSSLGATARRTASIRSARDDPAQPQHPADLNATAGPAGSHHRQPGSGAAAVPAAVLQPGTSR